MFWYCLLLLFPVQTSFAAASQDTALQLTAAQERYELSLQLQYLEDPQGTMALPDVEAGQAAGHFHGGQTQVLNFGFSHSAYWFYLRLENQASPQHEWILESQYPVMDQLDVYYRYADGRTGHLQAGDSVPFGQRSKPHHNLNFSLDLARGQAVDVYIRAQTTGSVQMPLTLWSEDAFSDKVSTEQILFGLYYGMLFSLAIYNFLLFIVIRDRNYLLYVLYIISYGLFQFSLNGLSFEYLWPNSPVWNNLCIAFFVGTGLFCITTFSRSFLSLKENSPLLYKLLTGFMVFFVLVSLSVFVLPYEDAIRIATVGALFAAISIMASGFVCLMKNFRPARYFFLSWVALLSGMVAYALKTFSLLPTTFLTEYGIQFGSVLEVLLLALALADRIKILQDENQRIQAGAQTMLEQHVHERTLELEQANRKLEELSVTDGLTGLKNRRFFNSTFELECKRASRNGDMLAVILIDIDHFKNLNDSYGHLVGDDCIRAVGEAITHATARVTDTKCRYGGEEFVVLMPSTSVEGAMTVAQKIWQAIGAIRIPHGDEMLSITASLGVATLAASGEDDVRQVLAQADTALYRAKASGRNSIVFFADASPDAVFEFAPRN